MCGILTSGKHWFLSFSGKMGFFPPQETASSAGKLESGGKAGLSGASAAAKASPMAKASRRHKRTFSQLLGSLVPVLAPADLDLQLVLQPDPAPRDARQVHLRRCGIRVLRERWFTTPSPRRSGGSDPPVPGPPWCCFPSEGGF